MPLTAEPAKTAPPTPLTEHPTTLAQRWRDAYQRGHLPPCPFCSNRGEHSAVLAVYTTDTMRQATFLNCPHTINIRGDDVRL